MHQKRLFIIDTMAMIFRNFHAFGARPISNSNGLPTSSIFGCAQFLFKVIGEEQPDYLVLACDTAAPTFRHELYQAYKANRSAMPEDLEVQIPHLYKMFEAMRLPMIQRPGFEADDIIGSLCKSHASDTLKCFIVSGDKDFMQLVNNNVVLYAPQKASEAKIIDAAGVMEKFGCTPEQVTDMLALIGDTADNVPGVKGIGPKGAVKLIEEFGNLEGIFNNLDKIKNPKLRDQLADARDAAFLSRKLVELKCDMDDFPSLEDMVLDVRSSLANRELSEFFKVMEFRRLGELVDQQLASESDVRVGIVGNTEVITSSEQNASADAITNTVAQTQPISNRDYNTILDRSSFDAICAELCDSECVSFDTETTGLDIINDTPIGVSLCGREGRAFYVPLAGEHGQTLTNDYISDGLRKVFASNSLKIAHNLKFDYQMFCRMGWQEFIDSASIVDTMLASYLLQSNQRSHGLDYLCLEHFNFRKIPTVDLLGKDKSASMRDVDLVRLSEYACEDVDYTLRLYNKLAPALKRENLWNLLIELEMPLCLVLAQMEIHGVYVNADTLAEISAGFRERLNQLKSEIYTHAGEEFNINSTKQLQVVIFDKLKIHEQLNITRLKKTKSGFSTDVSVLERMIAHPLPKALLAYRSLNKLLGTYVETLPLLINVKSRRVHTSFHQSGTATGRLSSSDPNLQNIPIRSVDGQQIRMAFCCENPESRLISADYSQVELRLMAHLTGDENLIEAFRNGEDIHTATARKIFAVAEVSREQRSQAKAINFGIIYGMGAGRLARETGVSFKEAEGFIERYFATYPGISRYIEEAIASAKKNLETRTMLGRKRPYSEDGADMSTGASPENIAVNSPIQGSAADLIKLAMVKLQPKLAAFQAKLILQVHDELLVECPLEYTQQVSALVKDTMENAMQLKVPLVVEVGVGKNWLEAHA